MRGTHLGPFALEALIGQGGMGQVWEAAHLGQGVPVAIKIMHADFARHGGFKGAFYEEVRAVSGLDHPNVVGVLDYGEVAAGTPHFIPGCPWLAMELVRGQNLYELIGRLPWESIRRILLSLLDGLAHAHARGVVHRDLKPGNVLVGDTVVLCDFGLAHAVDQECTDGDHIVGTPPYMAPEQFRGDWRDFGPWTDLYSLGCLTYSLVCGAPPFGYTDLEQCRRSHLEAAPPPLFPRTEVPRQLVDWIGVLLAKDPRRRFQRASDAAWALTQLGEERVSAADLAGFRPAEELPTVIAPSSECRTLVFDVHEEDTAPLTEVAPVPPPMPRDWRRPERSGVHLRGAGLGLWGLRSIPMVDRDAEREVLWRELRKVRVRRRARAVVLRGPAGCGKTRVADWLAERAEETGAAFTLRAGHQEKAGPQEGLGGMLDRALRCVALDEHQTRARVLEVLTRLGRHDPDEADALGELIRPVGNVTFGGPTERYLVLERLLALLAEQRPLVLVLDDVQWGPDSLAFCRHLLGRELPILLILTAQEEALADHPEELEALDALEARHLHIPMLSEGHQRQLLREKLGLTEALANELERRTGGNPLLAIQLVGDWVARAALRSTSQGFVLAADAPLPGDVHAVWAERVERVLRDQPATDRHALELAACLGQEVSDVEWRAVCTTAGLPRTDLIELLVRQGLARRQGGTRAWSFAHGMFRESVERRARDEGRWTSHALTCARTLSRGGDDPARLGRLLVEAEKPDLALAPLLEGAERAITSNEFRQARDLLGARDVALERARVPRSDPKWGQGVLLRLRMARVRVDRAAIEQWGDQLETSAERYGWTRLQALGELERAAADRKMGAIDEAFDRLARVERLCALDANPEALGRAAHIRGVMLTQMGELPRARAQLRRALTLLSEEPVYQVQCIHLLALVARYEGRREQALMLGRQALKTAETKGVRFLIPMCKLGLGEDARLAGDPVEAERWYREAAAGFEAIGSTDSVTANMNVGLALLEQRRWEQARPLLETARAVFEEQRRMTYLAAVHVSLLACVAAEQDWQRFDEHLEASKELLEETGFTDYDIPRFCALAAGMAEEAGERFRAMRGWALSAREWQRLGRDEEAEQAYQRAKVLRAPAG